MLPAINKHGAGTKRNLGTSTLPTQNINHGWRRTTILFSVKSLPSGKSWWRTRSKSVDDRRKTTWWTWRGIILPAKYRRPLPSLPGSRTFPSTPSTALFSVSLRILSPSGMCIQIWEDIECKICHWLFWHIAKITDQLKAVPNSILTSPASSDGSSYSPQSSLGSAFSAPTSTPEMMKSPAPILPPSPPSPIQVVIQPPVSNNTIFSQESSLR